MAVADGCSAISWETLTKEDCRCSDAPRYKQDKRGNRADGAVVKTTVSSYKMKCPSLRKTTRNEDFFGEFDSRRAHFFGFLFFSSQILSADFALHIVTITSL